MVWILHFGIVMKKRIFLSLLLVLILLAFLPIYLGRHKRPGKTPVSVRTDDGLSPSRTLDPRVFIDNPEELPGKSSQRSPWSRFTGKVADRSSPERKEAPPPLSLEALPTQPVHGESGISPSSVSLEALPTQPGQAESLMKRSVPKTGVLRAQDMPVVLFCQGEPILACLDCGLTDCDFALVVVDILAPGRTEDCKEAFAFLQSLNVGPVRAWGGANLDKPMTAGEMEEVRCSLSLAFDDKLIPLSPSIMKASLERFCQELKMTLEARGSSGIVKDSAVVSAGESGHQGGSDGVFSTPF